MNDLVIVTAISRPKNLSAVMKSVQQHASYAYWYAMPEPRHKEDVSGAPQRNMIIDYLLRFIHNGSDWVYFLDDDNLIHPKLVETLNRLDKKTHDVMTFAQMDTRGAVIRDGLSLERGNIDIGQCVFRLKTLTQTSFLEGCYESDASLIEELQSRQTSFLCTGEPVTYYNYLRPAK